MTVGCVLVPRFSLLAACDGSREVLLEPAALAPPPGSEQFIGEVSGAAEARGVRANMRLGEALSRCPDLILVPPDPGHTAELWETALRRLEETGAAVESGREGEAFFRADGLRGLHGSVAGALVAAKRRIAVPARVAGAPTRFAAYAAASTARQRRSTPPPIVPSSSLRDFLAPLPATILSERLGPDERAAQRLAATLERLGIDSLGALSALPRSSVSDRFGPLGLRAQRLASGWDDPVRPRPPHEALAESLELPEAVGGQQLDRALELLVDRLLAARERRGRTIRTLALTATLSGGGGWSMTAALRRPSASAGILRLALGPKLAGLPAPASSLRLAATSLGPEPSDQLELSRRPEDTRRQRLAEAARQVRAAVGPSALQRVLQVDEGSRVPERWTMLTPFIAPGETGPA